MNVTRGLIIDTPWIDHILEGRKDWEMRSQSTAVRGWIGLIRKGSGQLFGVAKLVDCGRALDQAEMIASQDHHRIPERMIRSGEVAKWVVPWKLADIRPLARPVSYVHKSGAVIWVMLSEDVSRQLIAATAQAVDEPSNMAPSLTRRVETLRGLTVVRSDDDATMPQKSLEKTSLGSLPDEHHRVLGRSRLTEGNINNNHFYLKGFLDAFPADTIGGTNANQAAARALTIDWGGPIPETTDIDLSKRMFRKRGWVRKFFAASGARAGDTVVVCSIGPYHMHVRIERAPDLGPF